MAFLKALMEPVEGQPQQPKPQPPAPVPQALQQQPHPHTPPRGSLTTTSSSSSSGSSGGRFDGSGMAGLDGSCFASYSPRSAALQSNASAYCTPTADYRGCGGPLITTVSLPDILPSQQQHGLFTQPSIVQQQHHQLHQLEQQSLYAGVTSISAPLPQYLQPGMFANAPQMQQQPQSQSATLMPAAASGFTTCYAQDWDSAFATAQPCSKVGPTLMPVPMSVQRAAPASSSSPLAAAGGQQLGLVTTAGIVLPEGVWAHQTAAPASNNMWGCAL